MFSPICPTDVRVLHAAAAQRAVRAMLDRPARVLVLASPGRCASLSLTPFLTALQGDGHAVQLYGDIPHNPAVEDVAALLTRLREQPFEPSAILAVGGGSCIDLAKAAGALYHLVRAPGVQAVREAIQAKAYLMPHILIDVLAMPTTAGTGSEVTRWATVWDPQLSRKLSVDHPQGFPRAAVLVPEWTLGMGAELTLSTGLDALSHAMEAYWAVARNPLSQELALAAVGKIRTALPLALAAPDDLPARTELCLGSLLAGLAFSQTRTTACHSMSYPLTLLKGVPHGFAAALTLASVLRRNGAAVPEMGRLTALFDGDGGFEAWLAYAARGVKGLALRDYGVTEADLGAIVDAAFTAGRMDNNPVAFTPEDVRGILEENL